MTLNHVTGVNIDETVGCAALKIGTLANTKMPPINDCSNICVIYLRPFKDL